MQQKISNDDDVASNSIRYKTVACKFFGRTGSCRKGLNCTYAHGDHELRRPYRLLDEAHPSFAQDNHSNAIPSRRITQNSADRQQSSICLGNAQSDQQGCMAPLTTPLTENVKKQILCISDLFKLGRDSEALLQFKINFL